MWILILFDKLSINYYTNLIWIRNLNFIQNSCALGLGFYFFLRLSVIYHPFVW